MPCSSLREREVRLEEKSTTGKYGSRVARTKIVNFARKRRGSSSRSHSSSARPTEREPSSRSVIRSCARYTTKGAPPTTSIVIQCAGYVRSNSTYFLILTAEFRRIVRSVLYESDHRPDGQRRPVTSRDSPTINRERLLVPKFYFLTLRRCRLSTGKSYTERRTVAIVHNRRYPVRFESGSPTARNPRIRMRASVTEKRRLLVAETRSQITFALDPSFSLFLDVRTRISFVPGTESTGG